MKTTKLLFTNKKGIEVIASAESISATQLAARLSWELDELGEDRILEAATNTYNDPQLGYNFLGLVKEFVEQRV